MAKTKSGRNFIIKIKIKAGREDEKSTSLSMDVMVADLLCFHLFSKNAENSVTELRNWCQETANDFGISQHSISKFMRERALEIIVKPSILKKMKNEFDPCNDDDDKLLF